MIPTHCVRAILEVDSFYSIAVDVFYRVEGVHGPESPAPIVALGAAPHQTAFNTTWHHIVMMASSMHTVSSSF